MLSYNETKKLIEWILSTPASDIRSLVHRRLKMMNMKEGEFYDSIVLHGMAMNLTSEQWFDILSKFPNRILRSQLPIEKILSENQILRLPPVTG